MAVAAIETVLTLPDDAQYQAKRQGGERVAALRIEVDDPNGRVDGD